MFSGFRRKYRLDKKRLRIAQAVIGLGVAGFALRGIHAQTHLGRGELTSLLMGFAPLFGLATLLFTFALLYSMLLYSAEQVFDDEDTTRASRPRDNTKWLDLVHFLLPALDHTLSLKEHSPPAILASWHLV